MSNLNLEEIRNEHQYYNNAFFAKWARLYDYEKYISTPLRRRAANFLNIKHPTKIIDIASGIGAQAYELAKLGHDVIGVDLSPEMLAQASKKINSSIKLRFQKADATDLPFKTDSFEAATISFGLHDMPYEVDKAVLNEIK